MFRNLSGGQWALFILLSFFTIFGGFLYVAAEAHYNRRDRDFDVSPAGAALLDRRVAAQVARAQARALKPAPAVPFAAYIVIAILLGFIAIKMFGQ